MGESEEEVSEYTINAEQAGQMRCTTSWLRYKAQWLRLLPSKATPIRMPRLARGWQIIRIHEENTCRSTGTGSLRESMRYGHHV
jgi:hypothetical protein